MDYYEELGLTDSASPEEIRQAYKHLARLLHPDPQGEESVRRLAEAQMKRLNAIYEVLGDPSRRRAYDLTLERGSAALVAAGPPASRWRRAPSDVRVAVLLVGVTLAVGALYWVFTAEAKPRPPAASRTWVPPAARAEPPDAPNPLTRELEHLRRRVQALKAERDAARAQIAGLRLKPYPSLAAGASATLPEPPAVADLERTEAASAPHLPAPSAPPPPPAPRARAGATRFAGTWFYSPSRRASAATTLYPPEYIETTIVEEAGLLRGRYYGRYRVSDRALSPEVLFHFEGRPQPESAELAWQGGGGARGEVRLKLLGENSLEVNWWATELGSSPGLAAGTAVLVRRID